MDSGKLETLLDGIVPLVYKEETGSTNDDAKRLAAQGEVPALVVAGCQTGGRGRRGNSFVSPKGGIYMSLATRVPSSSLELVTSFAGVCVCKALEDISGLSPGIKWINDIYLNGKKLAGILVENAGDYLVVGVGINGLVAPKFSGGVRSTALAEHTSDFDLEHICASIARSLFTGLVAGINAESTLGYCRDHSVLIGREVSFELHGKSFAGSVIDLAEDGSLLVSINGRQIKLVSVVCNVRLVEK